MTVKLTAKLALVLALALAAGVSSRTFAQDMPGAKTRAEVQAELLDAERTGNILAPGNSGKMLNELYPERYPAKPAMQGLTRAEVREQLLDAWRRGDSVLLENSGNDYPSHAMARPRPRME